MNIHYGVTGLLSTVWKVTQVNLSGLSELAREEGGRILIAHMLIWKSLPVADNLIDVDALILLLIIFFTYLKLCLATATHNFKWLKITHICLIWDKSFAHLDA